MDASIVKRLLALNREFYARFAADFSDSRSSDRVNLEPLRPYLAVGIRLLDVGCGNGRLAATLDRAGYDLHYVGVDSSRELLETARERTRKLRRVRAEFHLADLTVPGWTEAVAATAPFDLAVALAVLHHIPGDELRRAVLTSLRAVLKPHAVCILANWQFSRNDRLRKKIIPWETIGLSALQVDDGDALLDWKRGGVGYRYCHEFSEQEIAQLARVSGFQVAAQFYGEEGLNLYTVLQLA